MMTGAPPGSIFFDTENNESNDLYFIIAHLAKNPGQYPVLVLIIASPPNIHS